MIQYIRSFIFSFIALPVWTVAVCTLGLPIVLFPRPFFMKFIHFWADGVCFLEKYILNLTYEVRGLENLPSDQKCIVASKHMSTYETFKIHSLFKDAAVILKKELFLVPIWGAFLKKSDVIAVDRSNNKQAIKSVNEGSIRAIEQGRTIVIYPQGTRVMTTTTTQEKPYKPGVFRIYERTKATVVPLATNSGCFWPKGSLLKKSGTVIFEFLPVLNDDLNRDDFMNRLETQIETASRALFIEAENMHANRKS